MGAIPALSDAELTVYAAQAGASSSNWTMAGALKFMHNRRMDYFRTAPGDCGKQTAIDVGPIGGISQGAKLAGTAAGLTATLAGGIAGGSLSASGISAGIAAGGIAGTAAAAATGIGLALVPIMLFFGISAHHAAAVKLEQDTLCSVTYTYNQWADQIEAGLTSGQLTADQASAALDQIFAKLDSAMATIAKEGNAGWGFRIDLRALVLYNKAVVYPALAGSTLGGKSGLLIFGGAIAAAKVGGLF